ncbi:acetyl-CoA C-acetyltransferase [Trifolium repens]|nr:acetyl-CoA C-acetyltransferase [Trifolium repens]
MHAATKTDNTNQMLKKMLELYGYMENVSLLSWKRKQLWRKGSQLGLETIVDGVVKDGVWDVYSILTLEGISVKIN